MQTFPEALNESFKPIKDSTGEYYSFKFGDKDIYELCFEPLLFGNYYVALYQEGELIAHKVPIKPAK